MNTQKIVPVITSILVIIGAAFLREKSKTLAAILATMPINMPLVLWVVYSGDENMAAAANFTRNLMVGLAPAFIWLLVVFIALRLGWSLPLAIVSGYGVWVVLVGIAFATGWLSVPS